MKDYKIICFDFDGVIAEYNGWEGPNVFGKVITYTRDLMAYLKNRGYMVIIWTCRQVTPQLIEWLESNNVVYDSINDTSHNLPGTSNKPMYDVLIDDRALNFGMKGPHNLINKIDKLIKDKGNVTKRGNE